MKLEELWFANEKLFTVTGNGIQPEGQFKLKDKKIDQLPQVRSILRKFSKNSQLKKIHNYPPNFILIIFLFFS